MQLKNCRDRVESTSFRAHILTGRALLLGEESLSSEDWPVVENHLNQCGRCRQHAMKLVHNPILRHLQEKLHPTVEEIVAYVAPEVTPEELSLDASRHTYIQEHLRICVSCQKIGLMTQTMQDAL